MMRDAKNSVPLLLLTDYVSGRRMIFYIDSVRANLRSFI